MQSKIKIWVSTFRLRTLPLALASMLAGAYLAKIHNCFDYTIFALSCLTTIVLQILSNIANDYGDAENGADNSERLGPQRAVSSGLITKSQMKLAIIIFIIMSLASGISLLWVSFGKLDNTFISLLTLGLLSIAAAIKYTAGRNPYGYKGYGDIAVFIFFGLIAVIGSFFLYYKSFHWHTLPMAVVFGLLSASVLNINNIRDIETDLPAGKNTLAVKLGKKSAIRYQISIIIISAIILLTFLTFYISSSLITVVGCTFIFLFIIFKNMSLTSSLSAEMQTGVLKITALSTFATSLILFVFP